MDVGDPPGVARLRAVEAMAVDLVQGLVPGQPIGLDVPVPDRVAGGVGERGVAAGGGPLLGEGTVPVREHAAKLEMRHHLAGQRFERLALVGGQADRPRLAVDDADRAERLPVRRQQLGAGVEPQPVLAGDERVGGVAGIGRQVRRHEHAGLEHGFLADRDVERRLAHAEPDLRLEPLAVVGDEADHRDGNIEQAGRQAHDVVELRFPRRVENPVSVEGREPLTLAPGGIGGRVDHVAHGLPQGPRSRCVACRIRPCQQGIAAIGPA